MKTVYICISSQEYLPFYTQLYKSIKINCTNSHQILYFIGEDWKYWKAVEEYEDGTSDVINITKDYNKTIYSDPLTKICSLRARVVLNAFNNGYDRVVFCGAKIKFYDKPDALETSLNDHCAVLTPHITQPLPDDGKFPSNASLSFTGHISTDLVGFRNTPEIVEFLKWQNEIMKTQCNTTNFTYLDQSWLNFLPFLVDNVLIFKDPAYNVAYWNFKPRGLHFKEKKPFVGKIPLVCFQFSGILIEEPQKISRHQNRYEASGEFLEFLRDYCAKIK